jgi:hypothetical protein
MPVACDPKKERDVPVSNWPTREWVVAVACVWTVASDQTFQAGFYRRPALRWGFRPSDRVTIRECRKHSAHHSTVVNTLSLKISVCIRDRLSSGATFC